MGEIYRIFCLESKKSYIGQTEYHRGYKKRWKEHVNEALNFKEGCTALNSAIRKYGEHNFDVTLIDDHKDLIILDELEKQYIEEYNSLCPNGYNIKTGGKNGKHCEESREKMRLSKLGEKNHNYGKPRSDITKKKISNAKKGENHHFFGKNLTIKHKINLSKSHKKFDKSLPMYISYVKERPKYYQASGYGVTNHPKGKNKLFTSKKLSMDEKYNLALKYLEELNNL